MQWIKDHKAPLYIILVLIILSVGFFICRNPAIFLVSEDEAVHTALTRCGDPVKDKPLDIQAYVDIYKNVPPLGQTEPKNKLLPVWVVNVDAYWTLYGGPPMDDGSAPPPMTLYNRCTVVIDVITGDVILADFPTLE